jgi:DNA processing protein
LIDKGSPLIFELPNRYIELFCELKNTPEALYFTGNLELLNRRKIAIVGSRRASQYARNMTKQISNVSYKR